MGFRISTEMDNFDQQSLEVLQIQYAELLSKHGIFRSREFEYHKIVGQAYSNTFMTVVCKALSHDHFH